MEKNLKYGIYLQVYGELLTERQRDIIELYYDYDLSLAEISENLGISRQAVLDALKNACASLDNYEQKLAICKDRQRIKCVAEKLDELYQAGDIAALGKTINDFKASL